MTVQAAIWILLASLAFGVLLGITWTRQALQPNLRRQAEERRRLNAQWLAVRQARRRVGRVRCPRCGSLLSDGVRHERVQYAEDDEPDDDD